MDSLGELAHLGRGGHIVATLSVDLSDVGVGSGFVHATIIGTGSDHFRAMVDTLPTGRAADQFVLLSPPTVVDSIPLLLRSVHLHCTCRNSHP